MNNLYDPETFEIDRFPNFVLETYWLHRGGSYFWENCKIDFYDFLEFKEPIDDWVINVKRKLLLQFRQDVPSENIGFIAKQKALIDIFTIAEEEVSNRASVNLKIGKRQTIESNLGIESKIFLQKCGNKLEEEAKTGRFRRFAKEKLKEWESRGNLKENEEIEPLENKKLFGYLDYDFYKKCSTIMNNLSIKAKFINSVVAKCKDIIIYENAYRKYFEKTKDLINLLYFHSFNMFVMKETQLSSIEELHGHGCPVIYVEFYGDSKWNEKFGGRTYDQNMTKYVFTMGN